MASTLIAAIFKLSAIALFRLVSIATIGVLLSLKHVNCTLIHCLVLEETWNSGT